MPTVSLQKSQERQSKTRRQRNSNSSTTSEIHTCRGRSWGKGGRRGDEGRYDGELHGLALLWLELLAALVVLAQSHRQARSGPWTNHRFLARYLVRRPRTKQATFGPKGLKKKEAVPRVSFTTQQQPTSSKKQAIISNTSSNLKSVI